jgi:hypothetical protein
VSGYHVAFLVGSAMLALAGVLLAVTVRKQDAEAIDHGHAQPVPA